MAIHGTVSGRLGQKPELKGTGNKSFTPFSVATREYSGKGQEPQTVWVKGVAFGKTAEYLAKHGDKGNYVVCIGSIGLDEYQGKYSLKIMADKIELGGASSAKTVDSSQPASANQAPKPAEATVDEEDIPF